MPSQGTSRRLAVAIHSPGSRDRFERPACRNGRNYSVSAVLFYDLPVIETVSSTDDEATEVEGHEMRDKIIK